MYFVDWAPSSVSESDNLNACIQKLQVVEYYAARYPTDYFCGAWVVNILLQKVWKRLGRFCVDHFYLSSSVDLPSCLPAFFNLGKYQRKILDHCVGHKTKNTTASP